MINFKEYLDDISEFQKTDLYKEYDKIKNILETEQINEVFIDDIMVKFNNILNKTKIPAQLTSYVNKLKEDLDMLIKDTFFDNTLYWSIFNSNFLKNEEIIQNFKIALKKSKVTQFEFFTKFIEEVIPGYLDNNFNEDLRFDGNTLFTAGSGNLHALYSTHYNSLNISDDAKTIFNKIFENVYHVKGKGFGKAELLLILFTKDASEGSDVKINGKQLEVKSGIAGLAPSLYGSGRIVAKDMTENDFLMTKLLEEANQSDIFIPLTPNNKQFNILHKLIDSVYKDNKDEILEKIAKIYSKLLFNKDNVSFIKQCVKLMESKDVNNLQKLLVKIGLTNYQKKHKWDAIILISLKGTHNYRIIDPTNIEITDDITTTSVLSFSKGAGQAGSVVQLGHK